MQKHFSLAILLLAIGLVCSNCGKDKGNTPATPPTDTTGNNNNGNNSTGGTEPIKDTSGILRGGMVQLDSGLVQAACVRADYANILGVNTWAFSMLTSTGNSVTLDVFTSTLQLGTYTQAASQAGITILDSNGPTMGTKAGTNSSITVTCKFITDTSYAISFSGKLVSLDGSNTLHTISGTMKGVLNDAACPQ